MVTPVKSNRVEQSIVTQIEVKWTVWFAHRGEEVACIMGNGWDCKVPISIPEASAMATASEEEVMASFG